jgi:hypothetical protein
VAVASRVVLTDLHTRCELCGIDSHVSVQRLVCWGPGAWVIDFRADLVSRYS